MRPTSQMNHQYRYLVEWEIKKIVWEYCVLNWVLTTDWVYLWNILISKNGAARFNPMNGIPRYIAHPNAAKVAIIAEKLPMKPSHGFDFTGSLIMHVITLVILISISFRFIVVFHFLIQKWVKTLIYLNAAIRANVEVKYGTTVCVLRSSSWSSEREANRAIAICLNIPESSALPAILKNSSSHSFPLKLKSQTFQMQVQRFE